MIIRYEKHAEKMLIIRSCELGIDAFEAYLRARETICYGRASATKSSRRNKVYYKYYHDNISFFVICKKSDEFCIIKTVIIKRGRE